MATSGSSIATQIDPRQRSCQLLWLSSQWLTSHSLVAVHMAEVASGSRISPWVGSRIAMSEPASMISWRNAISGSLPANSPSGGKVSTRIA